MKLYLAVIKLNEEEYKEEKGHLYTSIMKYNDNEDVWYYVYGITDRKKLMKKFLSIHKDRFMVKILDLDDDEAEEILKEYSTSKIGLYQFDFANGTFVELPVAKMEYLCSVSYGEESITEEFAFLASVHPDIFKPRVSEWLDIVNYSKYFYSYYGTEEERDYFDYNKSYSPDYTTVNEVGLFTFTYKTFLDIDNLHAYIIPRIMTGRKEDN